MDLKEETMPKEDFKILIGGNIDELEISCRRGFPTNSCETNMKLTIVFADMAKGKYCTKARWKATFQRNMFCFLKKALESRPVLLSAMPLKKYLQKKL